MSVARTFLGRLRGERGFMLTDAVVSMALMVIVMGATSVAFGIFERVTRANQVQNDALDHTRLAVERLARELRNHAAPSPELPQGIERALPYDVIAASIGSSTPTAANARNKERVRYCLDGGSATTRARLWKQTQTWTGAVEPLPAATECPGAGWTTQQVVADFITNRVGDRPVFSYNNVVQLDELDEVRVSLHVDLEPGRAPAESRLSSGVYLRNQNRSPTAAFTATPAGSNHLLLNGTASTDPDRDSLAFEWFDGTTRIARGPLHDYVRPGTGPRTIRLVVRDPSGLAGETTTVVP